jgi:uncharacterized protein YegP (UPF0339 family)
MTKDRSTVEIYRDEVGELRWRVKASNGQKLANGGEGYKNQRDLISAIGIVEATVSNFADGYFSDEVDIEGGSELQYLQLQHPDSLLAGNPWLPREIARLLHEAGWADEKLIVMLAIVRAESALYDGAVGGPNPDGSMDYGLCQINSKHMSYFGFKNQDDFKAACFDAPTNIKFARSLYVGANYTFGPWSAYHNESYLKFMRMAILGVANYWASQNHLELLYG